MDGGLMFTDKQISGLKYLVAHSKDGGRLAKQLLWFLIDNSKNLTEPVSITLIQDREGFSRDAIQKLAHKADGFTSVNCNTFLHEIFYTMGSKLDFSLHYGQYHGEIFDTSGQFNGAPLMCYTFWLAEKGHGHSGPGKILTTSRLEIESIDIDKPGLYPGLENQIPSYNKIRCED